MRISFKKQKLMKQAPDTIKENIESILFKVRSFWIVATRLTDCNIWGAYARHPGDIAFLLQQNLLQHHFNMSSHYPNCYAILEDGPPNQMIPKLFDFNNFTRKTYCLGSHLVIFGPGSSEILAIIKIKSYNLRSCVLPCYNNMTD